MNLEPEPMPTPSTRLPSPPERRPETIACRLTPVGRGAVATVAIEGPEALDIVGKHFRLGSRTASFPIPPGMVAFGWWQHSAEAAEEVVVCSPQMGRWEIHCHGGQVAATSILVAASRAGARVVEWRDWLQDHCTDPLAAEATIALAEARTERTAAILLDQLRGALSGEIERILRYLTAGDRQAAVDRLGSLVGRATLGLHLTIPWLIVVAGAPNAGKSSLINRLLGYERSLVDSTPGTTRDVVTASAALGGWPVTFVDTAGLRATVDPLETAGIELARSAIERADLVVWVSDVTHAPAVVPPNVRCRSIRVHSKCDLLRSPVAGADFTTSAITGEGVDQLRDSMVRHLVPDPPNPGDPVPFTPRQAELLNRALHHVSAGEISEAIARLRSTLGGGTRTDRFAAVNRRGDV